MRGVWWIVVVVAVVVLVATYLTWLAGRVDRLHARAAAADAALDAHLVRRAAAAVALAEAAQLPALMYAARIALGGTDTDREVAENDLTHQLRTIVAGDDPVFAAVVAANRRVAIARQVHSDVVRDALRVRRRVAVRLLGMARGHPAPAYFDIDDPALDGSARRVPVIPGERAGDAPAAAVDRAAGAAAEHAVTLPPGAVVAPPAVGS